MDTDKIIILLRSKLKVEILNTLLKEQMTPLMLSRLLKRPRASISRAIRELDNLELVECINPEDDRWRKYKVTKKGEEILNELKKFLPILQVFLHQ